MAGNYAEHAVSLQRDTLSLPWGFRLQGGKDFKAPLTIQRVFVGSPADGVLHRGDILVSIENHDVTNLFHKQAQDIIKLGGGSLRMRVKRGSSYQASRPAPVTVPAAAAQQFFRGPGPTGPVPAAGALAFVPKPRPPMPTHSNVPSFGQDYSKGAQFPRKVPSQPPSNMLSRVQQSLNQAIWQPGAFDDYDPDYQYRPVHDLTRSFAEPPAQPQHGYGSRTSDTSPTRRQQQARPGHKHGGHHHVEPPHADYPRQPAQPPHHLDEDEEPQRSVSDLMGVFRERKEQDREYDPRDPQRRRFGNLPPAWTSDYHVDDDYETIPVKELKKKFGGKKYDKPRRARSNRPPPPPQIDLPTEEGDEVDSRVGAARSGKQWQPPDPSMYAGNKPLYEPGWSPKKSPTSPGAGWSPVKAPTMHGLPAPRSPHPHPVHQQAPANPHYHHQQVYEVPRVEEPSVPAWAGSLKAGGGVRPWEVAAARHVMPENTRSPPRGRSPQPPRSPQPQQQQHRVRQRSPRPPDAPDAGGPVQPHQPRVQAVSYGPGDVAPTYSQHDPGNYQGDAKVAHLQYNTPLGLYSRPNVEEALRGQTAGQPGEGTMQVTGGGPPGQKQFDPKQSSVLRMLQEQEGGPRGQPPPQSARYMEHDQGQEMQYAGYMDHYKQSPSMHALECNMSEEVGGGGGAPAAVGGTSDF